MSFVSLSFFFFLKKKRCTPLDDLEFRINARVRLDLFVVQGGLCQHQRPQKPDGTAGAKCLAHVDEHGQHAQKWFIGGNRAKLHDVGCQIIHNACCAAGLKSQRKVIVPTQATEKLTEPRVDVDARGHPGLPHIRKGQEEAHKRSERKRTGVGKRREVLESMASLCSSMDDSAQGWTCSFASLRGTNEQSTKQLTEMVDDHCKSGRNFGGSM